MEEKKETNKEDKENIKKGSEGDRKESDGNGKKESDEKEKRIRAITSIYYSNPKVQEAMLKFAQNREVVPRYFEGFGKRPDALQYPSDILSLVKRGATSFHASEEIWHDALKINSDMSREELDGLRKSWDLLIDIDSKYFDYCKIAAKLVVEALEEYNVKYGIKFSGGKGFHIIVSGKAFPKYFEGQETKNMFPEWARAICEFLTSRIRRKYNKLISEMNINFDAVKERTKLSKEELTEAICPECGRQSKKGKLVTFKCSECGATITRKDTKITKRQLKCLNEKCAGKLGVANEEDYFYCEYCNINSIDKIEKKDDAKIVVSDEGKENKNYSDGFEENISGNALAGGLDLVLVAPRHLFRMPYSLHEKTALASIVIKKEEIDLFLPSYANPLKVEIADYIPDNEEGEAERLLKEAVEWKQTTSSQEEVMQKKKFGEKFSNENREYEKIDAKDISEEIFPAPIKKLLKGVEDGKKRGLFILLTFFKSLNFSAEYINEKVREWNKLNKPQLREGYVKSQIEWHLKQKKKILPPNYDNESFYKDLNLLDKKPESKNPIVDVVKAIRKSRK